MSFCLKMLLHPAETVCILHDLACTCLSLETMGLPTKAEAVAYMQGQDLQSLLAIAVNQAVVEKAPDAAKRVGELLLKAAHDRENMQRMKELFATADTNRSGAIDIDELRTFTVKIGEPLDDPGLQKAFESMGGQNGGITFDAFASWYQGARAKGGELSRKGEAYTKRASRASRQSRASHEATDDNAGAASNFNIRACTIRETGEPKTLQYRVGLHYPDAEGNLAPISPWHDVPLYPAAAGPGEVHMIVEIPKWSRAKFEIATGEDYNPIKQDTKKGRLREYTYGDMLFNCARRGPVAPAHSLECTCTHAQRLRWLGAPAVESHCSDALHHCRWMLPSDPTLTLALCPAPPQMDASLRPNPNPSPVPCTTADGCFPQTQP